MTGGANGTFAIGGKDFVLTVKRSTADETTFDHFRSVQIDGKSLKAGTDYTAAKGSVVVTVKAASLNKLTAGSHTVTITFDDGKAETKLTVQNASKKPLVPATGDQNRIVIWVAALVLALAGIGISVTALVKSKKKNKAEE